MGVLLVVAVVVPALAGLATWRIGSPPLARTVVQWACAASVACWVAAAALGDVTFGPLGTDGLTAPVAAGVALAGAAVRRPLRRLPAALLGVGVTAATVGLAIAGGDGAPVDAASGLVGAAFAVGFATRSEADGGMRHAAAALAGAGLVGIGIAGLDGAALPTRGTVEGTTAWPVIVGAVVVLVAASARQRRALATLFPIALGIAIPILPLLDAGREAVAVVLAAGAAALSLRTATPPAAALGLLALSSSALAGTTEAALLLAAAAVVVHVAAVPVAVAAALPGATALALTLVDDTSWERLAVTALAVVVAVGTTRYVLRDQVAVGDDGARPGAWIALGLGGWLLVAPHTWTWAGDAAPPAWGTGAILAATGAAAALAVVTDLGNRPIPVGRIDAPEPYLGEPDGRLATVAAFVAVVVAAVASLALLLSVAR